MVYDGDVTKIGFAGLDQGEIAFKKAFDALVIELNDLEKNLNSKTAIWQGGAKEAYENTRLLWQNEAKGLADIVQLLAQNINITNMNMRDVERINASMFDGK
ncbi:WXG100 family type VII secretion target [Nonomuraea sp. NPDC046570]|uniref:WXG100 family type VII secretion target n=1 Tax=Nonomuraea sp. NPDC046570 TaxID=3155255 RepID=UPI0033FC9233